MEKRYLREKPLNFKTIFQHWRQIKISKRIYYSFIIILACMVLLTIVNLINLTSVLSAHQQVIKYNKYQHHLDHFSESVKTAQIHTEYLKRVFSGEKATPSFQDDFAIANIAATIETALEQLEPAILDFYAKDLTELRELTINMVKECNTWENNKTYANLININSTILTVQYFTDTLTSKLVLRISDSINIAERSITIARLTMVILNLIVVILLILLVFPLLSEIGVVFHPFRQASEKAFTGAYNAIYSSLKIYESVEHLKQVLLQMEKNIKNVSHGAEISSQQSERIIKSVKTCLDLLVGLAKITSSIYSDLNSNQKNLTEKIILFQKSYKNIGLSLERINQHSSFIKNLTGQVANLQQEVTVINNLLVSMIQINEELNLLALNSLKEVNQSTEKASPGLVSAVQNLSAKNQNLTAQVKTAIDNSQKVAGSVADSLNQIVQNEKVSAIKGDQVTHDLSNLQQVMESVYHFNNHIIKITTLQLEKTKQIKNRATEILESMKNISSQTDEVSASMELLTIAREVIKSQIDLIYSSSTETHEIVAKQVKLFKMAKDITEKI